MLMAVPCFVFLVVNFENALENWPVALAILAFALGCIIVGAFRIVRSR